MFSRREILAGAAAATAAQTLRAQAARRPNVVIFLADDLGCHDLGASDLATPNIDALAAGLRTGNCLRQVFVSKTFTGDVKGQALAMVNRIEYPGQWRDYSTLRIEPGDVDRAVKFESRRQLAKFGKPVDRREGFMTPPAVDAYYNPQTNDMNFPAGVLQPPLFDPNMDDAPNYGNTGGTIGHERTHGFDQYSQYTVVDELKINGKLTLGEHVTDLGGRQRLANRRHPKKARAHRKLHPRAASLHRLCPMGLRRRTPRKQARRRHHQPPLAGRISHQRRSREGAGIRQSLLVQIRSTHGAPPSHRVWCPGKMLLCALGGFA